MSSSSVSENGKQAFKYCLDNNDWFEGVCWKSLVRRDIPTDNGIVDELKQTVLINCNKIEDNLWQTVENKAGYIYRIVEHGADSIYREQKKRVEESLDSEEMERFLKRKPVRNPYDIDESVRYVEEIRSRLSIEDQRLFDLWLNYGFSEKEIAITLGVNYDTVRARISRLKKKLLKLTQEDGD